MTRDEAIAYIENYTWSKSRLGLERTRALLHALGDPQRELRFIHVAGSNGKGSTCAMLESVLRAAGYRTGIYTSPYIQEFCERIRIGEQNIPGGRLAAITERVAAAAETMEDHPSQFELVTAVGMLYFAEEGCDIVVLEVGMGGALDSTNVIDAPEAAVITNIGLEHTEYLGSTLAEIARTKAGIVKPGCSCVCYDLPPEAITVVEAVCAENDVPLTAADFSLLEPRSASLEGQRFAYRGAEYDLALLGAHQLRNAAVALETIEALRGRGWRIPEDAVRTGLRDVRWPARLELLGREPLFLLDGGHNPQCAEALAESVRALLPDKKPVFLMGVLADKDVPGIVDRILPLASECVCLTPSSDRAMPAEELAAYLTGRGVAARAYKCADEGIRAALNAAGENGAVVAFGSLYLAGAVRSAFPGTYKAWLRAEKLARRSRLTPMRCGFLSDRIVRRILQSPEFGRAETVMLYHAVRGEVCLQALEAAVGSRKRLVYPVCDPGGHMEAYAPADGSAWRPGLLGIPEPDPERSERIDPARIDLVLCPCAAFDERGARLGMGGGYYDRYLPRCENAVAAAVAFELQKAARIPAEAWDRSVEIVFTEDAVYRI